MQAHLKQIAKVERQRFAEDTNLQMLDLSTAA